MDYEVAKVAIVGAGIEGVAAINYFKCNYPAVVLHVFDESKEKEKEKKFWFKRVGKKIVCYFGEDCLSQLVGFDVVLVSPGISIYREELIHAKKQGAKIVATSQLWYEEHKKDFCIFVTGTKGKSTTGSLIYHVLNKTKKNVHLVGNIGQAAVSSIVSSSDNIWVVETSSYQAATLEVEPDIAVLTNLFPEHLDWHGGLKNYYLDKLRLFNKSKLNVINQKFKISLGRTDSVGKEVFFNKRTSFHNIKNIIYRGAEVVGIVDVRVLRGEHNMENVCAMLCVVDSMGVSPKKALMYLDDFRGLEHRLEELAEKNGVLFVSDCLSTTPQSTICAIKSYQRDKTTLIVGGMDRGLGALEWGKFCDYLSSSKLFAIIGLPDTGVKLIHELKLRGVSSQLYCVDELSDAVAIAKRITSGGGVVLLSPASPSHNQYKSYKHKADLFKKLVLENK